MMKKINICWQLNICKEMILDIMAAMIDKNVQIYLSFIITWKYAVCRFFMHLKYHV